MSSMGHYETFLADKFGRVRIDHSALANLYLLQAQICDRLEAIADDLPALDPTKIKRTFASLHDELPTLMSLEERFVLPALVKGCADRETVSRLCSHIEREHAEDSDRAIELQDMLECIAGQQRAREPEMVGFCLRAFFDTFGRHLAWECQSILQLMPTPLEARQLCQQLRGAIDLNHYAL